MLKNQYDFPYKYQIILYTVPVSEQICQNALSQYLRYGYVPEPLSIYEKTFKLEPGYIIKFNKKNKILKKVYWDSIKNFVNAKKNKFKGTFEDAKESVRQHIDYSITNRLVADNVILMRSDVTKNATKIKKCIVIYVLVCLIFIFSNFKKKNYTSYGIFCLFIVLFLKLF